MDDAEPNDAVDLTTPILAADYHALQRWVLRQPGAVRRQNQIALGFLLVLGLACLATDSLGIGLFLLALVVAVGPVTRWRYGRNLEKLRGTDPVSVVIDRYGVRTSGKTSADLGWRSADQIERTSTHLLLQWKGSGYVVPVAGLSDAERGRIDGYLANPSRVERPPSVGEASSSIDDRDAIVVRWRMTHVSSYVIGRYSQRATPTARRMLMTSRVFSVAIAVGLNFSFSDRTVGAALGGVPSGLALALLLPPLTAYTTSRFLPEGDVVTRSGLAGIDFDGPTGGSHADWSAIEAWSVWKNHLCLVAEGFAGLAIPLSAMADAAAVEALFHDNAGPPT